MKITNRTQKIKEGVARVDYFEPVKNIWQRVFDSGNTFLKHRTYVCNYSSGFFFLMKESYNGKYTELNFLQNLALRPKDEMQSAHFFGITVHSPLLFVPDIIFL